MGPYNFPHKVVMALHNRDHNGYTFWMSGKDSGFRIRVERDLREKFIEVCRAQDRPAAQVLRDYMRAHIRDHDEKQDNKDTSDRERC
jgi:hypothetical protein